MRLSEPRNQVSSVVAIRALASILVVVTHSIIYTESLPIFNSQFHIDEFIKNFGAIGVDIFFVLSGYILLYASEINKKPVLKFICDRILRIYPAYFVVLIISILIGLIKFYSGRGFFEFDVILRSIFLIPEIDELGKVKAVIGISWTLTYEIYFYIALAICWPLSYKIKTIAVSIIFLLIWQTSEIFAIGQPFFNNLIVLEFSIGMIIYCITRSKLMQSFTLVPLGVFLIAHFAFLFFSGWSGFENKLLPERFIYLGGPAGLFLLYVLIGVRRIPTFIAKIGAASYSIYLTHFTIVLPFIGGASRFIISIYGVQKLPVGFAFGYVLACIFASIFFGIVFYRHFEAGNAFKTSINSLINSHRTK